MANHLAAITAFLHELFEHAPEQWPHRLEELCARHPEVAGELRRRYELLRATGLDRAVDAGEPEPLPERLGEFRLLRRLGSGGMGMVFAAEQESLGREVAVKVVRPEFLFAAAARERFRREIEAIAMLEHPAIVPVLTHGEEGGVPFYVMPLVHGCPGDELVRRLAGRDPRTLTGADLQRAIAGGGGLPPDGSGTFAGTWWEACTRLVRQVALGLDHAHSRGIVHRDVKPSNILLTADGRALLFDFGLAHVRDDARITRSGQAPGSPAYMSPEQVRGRASDERTDVYSLAATLCDLLALRPPFPIADPEVLRERILAGRAESLRPCRVPAELQIAVGAAMDVDREQRHPSAAAFADDLQAVLERRPIRARPLPPGLRLRRWCARHRALAVGAAALAVFAAVLPAVFWWQQRAANASLRAETERAERGFQRSLAAIDDMLLRAGDEKLRNAPAAQAVAADLMQRAIDHFDRAAAEEADSSTFRPRHIAAILRLATFRLDLGETAVAEDLAARGLRMLREDGGDTADDHLRRANAEMVLSSCRLRAGKLREALAAADAVDAELGLVPTGDEVAIGVRARNATNRASILEQTGDAAGARAASATAHTAFAEKAKRLGRAFHRDAAVGAYNLAHAMRGDGETTAARELLGEALGWLEGLDEDAGAWPTPAMVRALVQAELGRVLRVAGDADGSAAAHRAAIAISERLVAKYPTVPALRRDLGGERCNLAAQFLDRREFDRGRELLELAVEDLEQAQREDRTDTAVPPWLFNARKSLCFALSEQADWPALAPAARAFGALPGDGRGPRGAARHLLRCAAGTQGDEAAALRDEALLLLLESERRGWGSAKLDDALYAPLQADARFAALRERVAAMRR